jgi:dTDP-4-dehydrorhamnose reductase
MKIYVFGATGMLGEYVTTYLSEFYDVIIINRDMIDASSITERQLSAKLFHLGVKKNDVIINCMGTIKPRVDELGPLNAILVNSVFPRILANACQSLEAKMIHPTTDCVFTGNDGDYTEDSIHDVTDTYGRTKSLGEPENCTVIRTSIIGEEVSQGRSLVEWIKSCKDKEANGYNNHYWNGMTCLQFAKVCHIIIDENLFWNGVKHIHSNYVDKCNLLKMVSDVYKLNIKVNEISGPTSCDRTLKSISIEPQFNIPELYTQIVDMKNFSKKLYENYELD